FWFPTAKGQYPVGLFNHKRVLADLDEMMQLRIGYFKAKTVLPSVLAVEAMRREITDVPYLLQWPRYQFAIITDPPESRREAPPWRHPHRSSQWTEGGGFVPTARTPRARSHPP